MSGTQYRSAIYTLNDAQRQAADASKSAYQKALAAKGLGAITTEIAPSGEFYFAEDYHQQYLAKNPAGYCGLGGTGVSCPIGAGRRGLIATKRASPFGVRPPAKNGLLTITGASLGLSRHEGWLRCGFARGVSTADHRHRDRARSVGLHAARMLRSRKHSRRATSTPWPMASRTIQRLPLHRHQASLIPGAPSARCATVSRPLRGAPMRRSRVAYAPAPMPVVHDAAYRLDAGDKLRVVVYGQEGSHQYLRDRCRRLDHHAADRCGAGAADVPRRGSLRRSPPNCATAISANRRWRWRSRPTGRSLFSARVAAPGQYPYVPNMSVESAWWRSRVVSRRAPVATASRSHIPMLPARSGWSFRSARRLVRGIRCWLASAGFEPNASSLPGFDPAIHRLRKSFF